MVGCLTTPHEAGAALRMSTEGAAQPNHCQDAEITPLGQIAIAGSSRVLASLMFFNFFCK